MAYEKQTWQTGDVVTSAKLNHMEDGIASAGRLVVNITWGEESGVMDKTWQEIHDAFSSGVVVVYIAEDDGGYAIYSMSDIGSIIGTSTYSVGIIGFGDNGVERFAFLASSADGYPAMAYM